ncbi:AAA family ATPase [Vibrio cholerae]|uniref:ATP-dependent nuclease n=1 Tax=Vibrio cholerae TaxID=666 RepID=UPI0018F08102|nr:AAA family ATPase [Vibrio cholerae]MBJ6972886.1 AAA family ATPase [Vibrio cholerae]
MAAKKNNDANARTRFNYRLKRLHIENLKGITDFPLDFNDEKRVTAIIGMNGSGKSTIIHALACTFKPKGKQTSKDYNRLSDFFTPNKHTDWEDARFTLEFSFDERNPNKKPQVTRKSDKEIFYKKQGAKQSRWLPIYGRRHERESAYIGLQDLATLNEDKHANRYKEFDTEQLAHNAADKIKQDMIYILGRNYEALYSHTSRKGGKVHTMFGLEFNGTAYSEHSMGAGEKRVLTILYTLHSPILTNGGFLLIDEVDVLLHGAAFKRLIEKIIQRSEENKIEVVFSTHRETITDFSHDINIVGVLNTGKGVIPMPNTNPQIMSQLTGDLTKPFHIAVEDELAEEICLNLIYRHHMQDYIEVTKFGAWSNAFALLAGKTLMGHDISNTLCVLDGDVCRAAEEREKEVKRHLNGDDRNNDRMAILQQIKEFKISHFAPKGQKGSPEYNIKNLFENNEYDDARLTALAACSRGVVGEDDWHCYFDRLANASGYRQARQNILEAIEDTEEWKKYCAEISNWIEGKAKDVQVNVRLPEPLLEEA